MSESKTVSLDIGANRSARKYSRGEQGWRILWVAGAFLFRLTPFFCYGLRNGLLRLFGARIGRHVRIARTVRIEMPWNLEIGDWSSIGFEALVYNLGPLVIGEKVTISQRAHLCGGSHDFRNPAMALIKSAITIKDQAWICADAFVGPAVTIGTCAVVAARAVVVADVENGTVVAGNPARMISLLGELMPDRPMS